VQEAVAAMRSLKPEQLQKPAVPFYHGVFLLAARQAEEAKPFLEPGTKRQMLVEERAMLVRVTAVYRSENLPLQKPAPPPKETWLNSPGMLPFLAQHPHNGSVTHRSPIPPFTDFPC
jgi:hypothetical protein